MGQEKEIPSGGRCSRGDYSSVQETFLTFFKKSCGLFQGIQLALSRNSVSLFKESYVPFQGVL